MNKLKIIYIKWFDASYNPEHQSEDEMNDEFIIESIGWYVKETKRCITISTEYINKYGTWRHNYHIPKVNIIKKKVVKL